MDATEHRLHTWGDWAGGFSRGGGYSTPMAKMIALGTITQASPDNWSNLPPEIELTERAIAQLKLYHPFLKKLIFQRYLYKLQPEEIATNIGKPKEYVISGLDKGRDWIGDWIDSHNQISNNLGRLAISDR